MSKREYKTISASNGGLCVLIDVTPTTLTKMCNTFLYGKKENLDWFTSAQWETLHHLCIEVKKRIDKRVESKNA